MEILEGSKYRNNNTQKSIMDIKIDDNYTIYVFQGNISKNDILIKYSKNGKRMRTPKHIHWVIDILLKEQINKLVSKGLDGVNISIDTLNADRYADITRGGKLEEALSGLEAALSFPALTVRINCVPTQDMPEEDYISLAHLARDKDLDVRFIEMMPIGLGKKFGIVSGEQVYSILKNKFGEAAECTGRFGNGPAVYVHFPGFKGKIGFIDAVSHQFCNTCNRVRLTSEGYLKPCLQYGTGSDLRKLLRSGADDTAVRHEMRRTIYDKPACHHFADCISGTGQTLETRDMSQIGG